MDQPQFSNDKIVEVYIKIRDARAELKRQFEAKDGELKAQAEKIEAHLLNTLNTSDMQSFKTAHGTVYRQEDILPSASDWNAFYDWVIQNNAIGEALEKRVKKAFIKQYMEEHQNELPPGISAIRQFQVRVRRD